MAFHETITVITEKTRNFASTINDLTKTLHDNTVHNKTSIEQLAQEKVSKEEGKVLSDENYSVDEKEKLAGIDENANNYSHPKTHQASIIIENSERRFVSDDEKKEWNEKVSIDGIPRNVNFIESNGVVEKLASGGKEYYLDSSKTCIIGNAHGKRLDFDMENKIVTIPQHSYLTTMGKKVFYNGDNDIKIDFGSVPQNKGERYLAYSLEKNYFEILTANNIDKTCLIIATWWSIDTKTSITCSSPYTINGEKVDVYNENLDINNLIVGNMKKHGNIGVVSSAISKAINFDFVSKVVEIPAHSFIVCGGERIYYNNLAETIRITGAGVKALLFNLTENKFEIIAFNSTFNKNTLLIAMWWGEDYPKTLSCPSKYTLNGEYVDNYNEPLSRYALVDDLESKNLRNSKVLIIGDSISTDYYGNYKKWVTNLIDEGFLPDDTTNSSFHATGFVATTSGYENFITRIEKVQNKDIYDFVIIFGGINDFIQSVSLGEIGGDKTTEFKPAVDYFFEYLVDNFTQARIIVLSPLRTYNIYPNQTGNKQEIYVEYINTVAKKYCLPILNLTEESGFCPFIDSFKKKWTFIPQGYEVNDGVHPNEEYEKKFLSPIIKNFIKKYV